MRGIRNFLFVVGFALVFFVSPARTQSPSFFYVATAVDVNGFESAFSNEVNVVFVQGKHIAVLTWTASVVPAGGAAIAGYKIYRGTVKGGPYALVTPVLVKAVTYSDSFLLPNAPSISAALQ